MERLRRVRDLHQLERAHGAQPKKPIEFLGIQSFLGSLLFRVFRSGSSVGSFSRVWF